MLDVVRVLLVVAHDEDAAAARRAMAAWERHEFRVERARSLAELARRWTPEHDVMVLDTDLGDSTGLDSVREALVRCSDRPVVVFSDIEPDSADGIIALREGAEDVVPKRKAHALGCAIAFALERYRLTHSARAAAVSDGLTGLPNRTLFADRLESALRRSDRNDAGVAVLYMDLDGFKPINDQHGHGVGDLILKKVADRMRRMLRASDTVARLGGDEFGVVLEEIGGELAARAVAAKLRRDISRPIRIRSRTSGKTVELAVGASVGVAIYPQHASSAGQLVKCADAAMYQAKDAPDGVVLATPIVEEVTAPDRRAEMLASYDVDETLPPFVPES